MSNDLLVRYIGMVVEATRDARVPNQLVNDEGADDSSGDEAEEVNEFSGVGAVAGYTAPLGADPNALGRKKNRSNKK